MDVTSEPITAKKRMHIERITLVCVVSARRCDALSGRLLYLGGLCGLPGNIFEASWGILETSWGPPGGPSGCPGDLFGRRVQAVLAPPVSGGPLRAFLKLS